MQEKTFSLCGRLNCDVLLQLNVGRVEGLCSVTVAIISTMSLEEDMLHVMYWTRTTPDYHNDTLLQPQIVSSYEWCKLLRPLY